MLAFGRAMMAQPVLLLLDEPSLGLAPIVVEEVAKAIEHFRADGVTVLLVEQNAELALTLAIARLCDRDRQHRARRFERAPAAESASLGELSRPGGLGVRNACNKSADRSPAAS